MKPFLKTYAPPAISGALLGFSFPTWNLWPLAWVALVPLLVQTASLSPRAAAGRFFLAGWVFNSILLQWIMATVYWGGGWGFLGYQAVCVIMAAYWALLGFTWAWLRRRAQVDLPPSVPPYTAASLTRRTGVRPGGRAGQGAFGLAVLWVAMEFAQAHLFTGFGWGALAYSQGPNLFALQWASIGGAYLVSGLIVLVNALIALAISLPPLIPPHAGGRQWRRYARITTAAFVLLAAHVGGFFMLDEADYDSAPFEVGILQANFPLEMKHDPEYTVDMVRSAIDKSWAITEIADVDLMIWPEALVMTNITSPRVFDPIAAFTTETGVPVFTGAERENVETGGAFNSSALIADGKLVGYYDKVHLAPFGEYAPFSHYLPAIKDMIPAIGDMDAGAEHKVIAHDGRTMGPLICFEVLFADIAERLRGLGADHLVVVANLGWFGASSAIAQELDIARVRAIETRLPLINCANTGISGVFDPYGRFTMLNAVYAPSGRLPRPGRTLDPKDTVMLRMGDALPVPAPAQRPFANGPVIFPWATLALAAVFIIYAAIRKRKDVPIMELDTDPDEGRD